MTKQKKSVLALAILLIGAIGIGFAALSDFVKVNGTASAITPDFKLEYMTETPIDTFGANDAAPDTEIATIKTTAEYTDAKTATMTVEGLKNKDDIATATFTVKNTGEVAAVLEAVCEMSAENKYSDYYEITPVIPTNEEETEPNLAPGAERTFTVEVKLIKVFKNDAAAATPQTFTITVSGDASEEIPEGSGE